MLERGGDHALETQGSMVVITPKLQGPWEVASNRKALRAPSEPKDAHLPVLKESTASLRNQWLPGGGSPVASPQEGPVTRKALRALPGTQDVPTFL